MTRKIQKNNIITTTNMNWNVSSSFSFIFFFKLILLLVLIHDGICMKKKKSTTTNNNGRRHIHRNNNNDIIWNYINEIQENNYYARTGLLRNESHFIQYKNHPFESYYYNNDYFNFQRNLMEEGEDNTTTTNTTTTTTHNEEMDNNETETKYEPIRITIDTTSLEETIANVFSSSSSTTTTTTNNSNTQQQQQQQKIDILNIKLNFIVDELLPKAIEYWTSTISVIPIENNLFISTYDLYNESYCGDIEFTKIPIDHQLYGIPNTDLILYISGTTFITNGNDNDNDNDNNDEDDQDMNSSKFCYQDGTGPLIIGISCNYDQYDRPTAGNLHICIDQIQLDENDIVVDTNDNDNDDNSTTSTTSTTPNNKNKNKNNPNPLPSTFTSSSTNMNTINSITTSSILSSKIFTSSSYGIRSISDTIHEITHILGFTSTSLRFFWDSTIGKPRTERPFVPQDNILCVDGNYYNNVLLPSNTTIQFHNYIDETTNISIGKQHVTIITPKVQSIVRNHFNCQSLIGAKLENQPILSNSCIGDHWDGHDFYTELLSAASTSNHNNNNNIKNHLPSHLTLSLLEDSGWYVVNYDMAEMLSWGFRSGCNFVTKSCIIPPQPSSSQQQQQQNNNNDNDIPTIPEYSYGYFCNNPNERSCSTTLTHKMSCNVLDYTMIYEQLSSEISTPDSIIPKEYQYFPTYSNENFLLLGGSPQVDYCPVYDGLYEDYTLDELSCTNINNQPRLNVFGEVYGPNSQCIPTVPSSDENLGGSGTSEGSIIGGGVERNVNGGLCYRTRCDERFRKLQINFRGTWYTCNNDLDEIELSLDIKIICPRLSIACPNLISCPNLCNGRGICNYDLTITPICECYDKFDTTNDCSNSFLIDGTEFDTLEPTEAPFIVLPPNLLFGPGSGQDGDNDGGDGDIVSADDNNNNNSQNEEPTIVQTISPSPSSSSIRPPSDPTSSSSSSSTTTIITYLSTTLIYLFIGYYY